MRILALLRSENVVPIINSANRKRTKAIKYTLMVIIEDVVHIATHALPRSA